MRQCGLSMQVPQLVNVFDQSLGFDCTGSYENDDGASLSANFQYDPNLGSGGSVLTFDVEAVGIDKKMENGRESLFKIDDGNALPRLKSGSSISTSNCGTSPNVKVIALSGVNWYGWIAEESYGKPAHGCKLVKEYTSAFRCVHLMIGHKKMVAQVGGVCLLRRKEHSLENGFSYDLFMDMVKSIRFNEN